jgi:hypothetical protein
MKQTNTLQTKTPRKPSGFVLWEGASLIDGSPIVVIGTISSRNIKTGKMLQTWILRADLDPLTANRTGEDYSICGNCPLRGEANPGKVSGTADNRGCYVQIGQAPASVYRTYKAGKYPRAIVYGGLLFDPALFDATGIPTVSGAPCIGKGQTVRLGAYGDPAAVPGHIWDMLTKFATGWTGYTHQSGIIATAPIDKCMVSADSAIDAMKAWGKGYRTFRIVAHTSEVIRAKEIICPATPEGGNKATCTECRLCMGSVKTGKSVAVIAHGAGKKHAIAYGQTVAA